VSARNDPGFLASGFSVFLKMLQLRLRLTFFPPKAVEFFCVLRGCRFIGTLFWGAANPMSRAYRHLWREITSFENLLLAFRKAARGKRSRSGVVGFEFRLEEHLVELRRNLLDGAYRPGGYTSFVVHDPKRRLISAAPFGDRVVHHALMHVTGPLFERSFIDDSFANRVGKGTHKALDRCTYYLRRYRYVLPLDVRQFFPSIDHAILLANLSRTIADEKALNL